MFREKSTPRHSNNAVCTEMYTTPTMRSRVKRSKPKRANAEGFRPTKNAAHPHKHWMKAALPFSRWMVEKSGVEPPTLTLRT